MIAWITNFKEVLGKPKLYVPFWDMATTLDNSAAVVVVVVVRTRPRASPLAMRKSTNAFPFFHV